MKSSTSRDRGAPRSGLRKRPPPQEPGALSLPLCPFEDLAAVVEVSAARLEAGNRVGRVPAESQDRLAAHPQKCAHLGLGQEYTPLPAPGRPRWDAVPVHVRTATWFWDQEIFDFIAAHLSCFSELSMRLYRQAWELKTAGLDWRAYILGRTLDDKTRLVARLKADPSYATEDERIQAFVALGAGCRQTYYNHAAKLHAKVAPPAITLHNPPPRARLTDEALINRLRRRFGHLGNS